MLFIIMVPFALGAMLFTRRRGACVALCRRVRLRVAGRARRPPAVRGNLGFPCCLPRVVAGAERRRQWLRRCPPPSRAPSRRRRRRSSASSNRGGAADCVVWLLY